MTKEQKLEAINKACQGCTNCELHKTRTNIVFGEGSINPDLLIIGEAPGENEDLQSKPFVGRSGKLLDKLLNEQNFDRKTNVYILNMIKCRPPKNRDPKPEELRLCEAYLTKQIELLNPKAILCLGRVSATKLIDKDLKISKEHGKVFDPSLCASQTLNQTSAIISATFHPAALLRNPNNIPLFQADLDKLKRMIDKV